MVSGKKGFIITEMILGLLAAVLAVSMLLGKGEQKRNKVSVILQNADDSRWASAKYGLKTAGEDFGVEVTIVNMESGSTAKKQRQMIETELKNGADALIVQPAAGAKAESAVTQVRKNIPIMLLESISSKDSEKKEWAVTEPDNYEMGQNLAKELLKDYNENLQGKRIGILAETMDMETIRRRDEGFRDAIKEANGEIIWSVAGSFTEASGTLTSWPKVDIVIALDDRSVKTAGRYAAGNQLWGAVVYGIGHSTEAVYYLDTRNVECLVVPDEFDAGYQSLKEVAQALEKFWPEMKSRRIAHTVFRRACLFTKESQKILFTMSQ
ncbi:substrate-binding domain-containing protein [Faecalicatena sp. Marseille-Q4148]|nr:substrate-binding domain-containing protein [Faecalicatena sp. Marseille-Q4148]